MKSLVAGAGGAIGGHLVRRLLDEGHEVTAVDIKEFDDWFQLHSEARNMRADLRSIESCQNVVRGQDRVYNLAADMGGMGFIASHKADCMLSVLINTHLLMAARDAGGVDRFFYSSSACIYPDYRQEDADVLALREVDAYPAMPEDGYGWEKLFSERMCRHFEEDFGIPVRIARFHNVYGPHGTYDGGREKAPAAICRKVLEAQRSGVPEIEIWGDGEQTRSFMYVEDCVDGIQRITNGTSSEPVNLGSSELVSINQLVQIVEEIAGCKLERIYDLSKPQGVRGRNSDNTMIQKIYGWEPSIPLREGLAKTYRWIDEQLHR